WAARLTSSFARYRALWQARPARPRPERDAAEARALALLEGNILPDCRALRDYNVRQIEESELVHRRTLRWMAWGLAGVGGIGSLAGLLLGYAAARGLRRSLHQLSVHIQDAADKLDLPAVILTGSDPDELRQQMGGLVREIELVVQRLRQREHEVL